MLALHTSRLQQLPILAPTRCELIQQCEMALLQARGCTPSGQFAAQLRSHKPSLSTKLVASLACSTQTGFHRFDIQRFIDLRPFVCLITWPTTRHTHWAHPAQTSNCFHHLGHCWVHKNWQTEQAQSNAGETQNIGAQERAHFVWRKGLSRRIQGPDLPPILTRLSLHTRSKINTRVTDGCQANVKTATSSSAARMLAPTGKITMMATSHLCHVKL